MEEEYNGVKIKVVEQKNGRGKFTLLWSGHEPEEIESKYQQSQYVMMEAKYFVDTWIEEGYIVLKEINL